MSNATSGSITYAGGDGWLTGGGGQPVVPVTSVGGAYIQQKAAQALTSLPTYTLLGEQFAVHSAVDFAVAMRSAPNSVVWCVSQETLDCLRSEPGPKLHRKINQLRDARARGETVVRGIVTHNPRRPDPAPRPRATLDDLQSRVKALITQIAELLDRGPIPEAQMGELSSMTARLQAEMAEARSKLDEVDAQLAMARGLIVAYNTDPTDEPSPAT